jgi:cytochrome c-type biogenesis protein CcsB
MFAMNLLWVLLALSCYFASAAVFATERLGAANRWSNDAAGLLAAGAGLQLIEFAAGTIRTGNLPVTNFAQSLSFLAWLTALAGLILIVRFKMPVIGTFVAPIVFVVLGAATLTMGDRRLTVPSTLRSAWLPVHVTLAFLGYALFVLAAGVSLVYLIYERRLKAKRLSLSDARPAPSLEKLDRINYRLLGWGFLMLTLAIISGAIWANTIWGHFWSWEPQESWSLVIWLLYAALLESRLTIGWRGRRAAALTIILFSVLVCSFLGVSLVTPGKHGGSFG